MPSHLDDSVAPAAATGPQGAADPAVLAVDQPDRALALPRAVLWDLDGTLIDSEPYWMAAEYELVRSRGGSWTHDDALSLVGNPLGSSALILQAHGVDLSVEEIITFLITRVAAQVAGAVPWQPGAAEALAWLRANDVPCALVTMSYRSLADSFVARAPAGTFAAVVAGDEVTHGKPHPEPYLRAAELLGVPIEECLVVEDSPAGVGSALACGAVAVGVEVMVPLPVSSRLSRLSSLHDFTPDLVDRVVRGEVIDLLPAQA
ncbi:HAD family hydrolase [Sanguibacter antarcticus]|uniref:HAD superfamily hydrolase (TIGR01509 family) n=1 Tax=Sanguibacter antarcticus TaxID=372484 RepID=A0A2A9E561_9MICO|nr:HAD family phosphatase [Sanguibacter antarcticus]PFG33320.1 HAD superfamily hydrolase (TIGR01509 family) [Sanguibacter antarcticus]